jgi:hypothetical protein
MRHHLTVSLVVIVACLLAGCGQLAPPSTPPQLNATPGKVIVITDEWVDTGVFRAYYPVGWRVVKANAAGAPPVIVLVSPDDAITITLYAEVDDAELSDATVVQTVTIENTRVTIALRASDDQINYARTQFEQVVASVVSSE